MKLLFDSEASGQLLFALRSRDKVAPEIKAGDQFKQLFFTVSTDDVTDYRNADADHGREVKLLRHNVQHEPDDQEHGVQYT